MSRSLIKWRAKFQISWLVIRNSDWLNFIHFSEYKHKIRLVSRLRKREDQAFFLISIILKFSAQLRLHQNTWYKILQAEPHIKSYITRYILYMQNCKTCYCMCILQYAMYIKLYNLQYMSICILCTLGRKNTTI